MPFWKSSNLLIVRILFFGVLHQSFAEGNGVIVPIFRAVLWAVPVRQAPGNFDCIFSQE